MWQYRTTHARPHQCTQPTFPRPHPRPTHKNPHPPTHDPISCGPASLLSIPTAPPLASASSDTDAASSRRTPAPRPLTGPRRIPSRDPAASHRRKGALLDAALAEANRERRSPTTAPPPTSTTRRTRMYRPPCSPAPPGTTASACIRRRLGQGGTTEATGTSRARPLRAGGASRAAGAGGRCERCSGGRC
ncbi:extensin-like [Triticum dicoccoides]|uniref:extensin-like n=1 Tax=Triticum dicoccoides TaxID=85692 RepID=UPI00188FAE9A|nr:extensin-like [Triticum dicoccoides]